MISMVFYMISIVFYKAARHLLRISWPTGHLLRILWMSNVRAFVGQKFSVCMSRLYL